jgi:hypothetical protein
MNMHGVGRGQLETGVLDRRLSTKETNMKTICMLARQVTALFNKSTVGKIIGQNFH